MCYLRTLILCIIPLFFLHGGVANAQQTPPFAVLKKGPEQQWGIPGFADNSGLCLYGAYTVQNGKTVEVWAVPTALQYDSLWKNASFSAGRQVFQHTTQSLFSLKITLQNKQPHMQGALQWTMIFAFEGDNTNAVAFIDFFVPRFEYFGSMTKNSAEISFPAVLGAAKN